MNVKAFEHSAAAAILYEANTDTVLYETNADEQKLIASTTKIMTALVALNNGDIAEEVVIKPEYTNIEGSSMYLEAGDRYSLQELLYGLLLTSGNDAAVAIACHISGNVEAFAALMNETAKSIGCTNSNFKNPNGLDEEGHYSSARDLALITDTAYENTVFRNIVSTKSIEIAGHTYTNHNKLLWQYEDITGVKTGYTNSSGRTLVSCAERDGARYICVTLDDSNDWEDHKAFYDWAFENYRIETITPAAVKYEIEVISGEEKNVSAAVKEGYIFLLASDDSYELNVDLKKFLYADVYKGQRVGSVSVIINGNLRMTIPILTSNSVAIDRG